jgi:hypothetical protein
MKILLLMSMVFASGLAGASSGLNCTLEEGNFPVREGRVESVAVGLTRINGVVYRNYTVSFFPSAETGTLFAKVWGPGRDPRDAYSSSAILLCDNSTADRGADMDMELTPVARSGRRTIRSGLPVIGSLIHCSGPKGCQCTSGRIVPPGERCN